VPKKLRLVGDDWPLKLRTLKVNGCEWNCYFISTLQDLLSGNVYLHKFSMKLIQVV
jgi:hypothetical protein